MFLTFIILNSNFGSSREIMLATEGDEGICLSSVKTSIITAAQMTFSQTKSHEFYWRMIRILFHFVLETRYTLQLFWDYVCHKLMIWFFSIMYIFEPFGGSTLAYLLTSTGAWMVYILSSLISKGVKVKKKQPSQWIGLCKSKMVLSNYMHSLAWTGYLRKLGCEPITISCRFHRLGLKGMLILHALCTNSVGVLATRTQILLC